MAMWVIAMDEFSKVYKDVEPKIKKASEAEAILKEVNSSRVCCKTKRLMHQPIDSR